MQVFHTGIYLQLIKTSVTKMNVTAHSWILPGCFDLKKYRGTLLYIMQSHNLQPEGKN